QLVRPHTAVAVHDPHAVCHEPDVLDEAALQQVDHSLQRLQLADLGHAPLVLFVLIRLEVGKREHAIDVWVRHVRQHDAALGDDDDPSARIRGHLDGPDLTVCTDLLAQLRRVVADPALIHPHRLAPVGHLLRAGHDRPVCVSDIRPAASAVFVHARPWHDPPALLGPPAHDLRFWHVAHLDDEAAVVNVHGVRVQVNLPPRHVVDGDLALQPRPRPRRRVPRHIEKAATTHTTAPRRLLDFAPQLEMVPQVVLDDALDDAG